MPIKNLTNRGLAFPEIGQIRKGSPKPERGPGKDLTYFRVEFDEREETAAKTFLAKYGNEPQEINILLPFNEIENCWGAWLEAYTAGRMVARSDGEKFHYLVDTKTGEILVKNGIPFKQYIEGQSVGTYVDGKGKTQNIYCAAVGRLKVVIPELQRLAYVTIMTTSKHDIANLDAQMEALKQVNNGVIAGIPMVLRRRPKKISTPKPDGSRVRFTKWMLSIEADPNWVKAKLLEVKHLALPGNGFDLLPEGEIEEPIDLKFVESGEEILEDEIPSNPDIEDELNDQTIEEAVISRPYKPEVVKEKIKTLADDQYKDDKPSQAQVNLTVGMLDACFADDQAKLKRYEICKYLTGEASSKKIAGPYILALLKWLDPQQDNGGALIPNEYASKEANSILTVSRVKDGQGTLI